MLAKAKREFQKQLFEKLITYLEIVVPELQRWTFSGHLELRDGVNVMDLSDMRLETQQLVIASTIEHAFQKLSGVVVIIPEAWEMLPQFRMTPVKWVAEQFVRKGAAIKNYLWIDCQDIGGISKTPLRQCDNWLMGRMKEAHEVERILKQLLGMKVPAEEIQTLPLGHFYAAIGNEVKKVYVLPAGVSEEIGQKVATGKLTPEYVRDRVLSRLREEEDDEVWRQECEKLEAKLREVETEKKDLEEKLKKAMKGGSKEIQRLEEELGRLKEEIERVQTEKASLLGEIQAFNDFKKALAGILPKQHLGEPVLESKATFSEAQLLALVDVRVKQRLSAVKEVKVVEVDVRDRIKELVKADYMEKLVQRLNALPNVAKKAALWLHEKKEVKIGDLYYHFYQKTGRIPGAFYINVVNPLEEAWLIKNDAGNIKWVLDDRLWAELKNVLSESDVPALRDYLLSLLL
jgi:archaellum component FlaC